jgi:hypothetical protein
LGFEGLHHHHQTFKEGNVKRPLILLLILSLAVPVLFLGCSGDDGSTGSAGAPGAPGAPGLPGDPGAPGPVTTTNESCVVCHGAGKIADVAVFMPDPTAVNLAVDNLALTNTGGFGVVSFNLKRGTSNYSTLTAGAVRLYVADLVPAGTVGVNTESSNFFKRWAYERSTADTGTFPEYVAWTSFTNNGAGNYTIVMSNALANAVNAADVQRLYLRISGVTAPGLTFNPVAGILDFNIPAVGATVTAAGLPQYQKAYVTLQACQKCHGNPLQGVAHGSSYADIRGCVVCHSPLLELPDPDEAIYPPVINASTFFHKIHAAIEVPEFPDRYFINGVERSYDAVTFPQEVKDCVICHNDGGNNLTGTAALIDNWKNHPTIEACTSCHNVTFSGVTPTHGGGAQVDANCSLCHPATGTGVGKSVTTAHAIVPPAVDTPEFDVTISRTAYPNGTHYVAGDNVTVTVTLKNHADNSAVNSSVYTTPRDAVGVAGGGLRTASLYVYGPRARSIPVLATNTITDPAHTFNDNTTFATQGHSLFVGGTDLRVATDNTGFKYRLFTIPSGMTAGTYVMHFEGADYGGVTDNNYKTSSTATITFQVGTATPSLKVAGIGCLDCHGATRMHLQGSHAHNVPFDTDSCLACHDQSSNYGDPIANRAHAIHSANTEGDLYNQRPTTTNPRDWSGITYPQIIRDDETGLLTTGVRCLTCHTSGNTTYKTNPFMMPCTGCHVRTGNGVIDHMRQNGGGF